MRISILSTAIGAILSLTACAPGQAFDPTPNDSHARSVARQAANEGRTEDVRFCQYEADKSNVYGDTNRNEIVQAINVVERRAAIFNSCMRYRSGK